MPWYPELATSPVPELPGMALHFVFMAAIVSRKLGAVAVSDFERELRHLFSPMKESAKDLSEGAMRTARILGLIVVSRGLVCPGEALLATRPWWEQ